MKELVMVDDRIYLAEPIQANETLAKAVARIDLRFEKETFIKALEERLTKCEKQLEEAVKNDLVISVTESVITFFNPDKTAGRFIIPSFLAMESTIEKLQGVDSGTVDCATLNTLLTRLELNQLKKALVTYIGKWDQGASALEELEFAKADHYVAGSDESC